MVSTSLGGEGFNFSESTGKVRKNEKASTSTIVVWIWPSWRASPDVDVLAYLMAPLWIKMGRRKDVDFTVPCPVTVDDLPAKVRDIAIVEAIACLRMPGLLARTCTRWRVIVKLFWCWQISDDLLWSSESIHTHRPDL